MGLRDAKRRAQRRDIIENAVALFREAGPDAVRVREIAARAEVSEATFFNYFPSKHALLQEWADDALESAFVLAADEGRGHSLRRDVRALAAALAERVEAEGTLLVQALEAGRAIAGSATDPDAPGRASRVDGALRLVEHAAARGEVRADVAPEQLAELLRGVLRTTLAHAAARGATDRAALARRLRTAADVLLDGYRKRNERVRGSVHAAPPA